MRSIQLARLHRLAVLVAAVLATATAAVAADGPSSTVPDKVKYDSEKGKAAYAATLPRIAAAKAGCKVIFIGDSITAGWLGANGKEVWDAHFAKYQPLDFGIGGDRTQHVLWRLENPDLAAIHPQVAVILIGTNNTGDTPADIAAGVKAVVAKTQAVFPQITVVLLSILPNQRATEKMAAANELIKPVADGAKVVWLDLAAKMTKDGDNWKGLLPDKLHLTREGYELWAAELDPVLAKLLP